MKIFARTRSRDPLHIRDTLKRMSEDILNSLGADLESVIVYGVFARNHRLETTHDTVSVMLVLKNATCQTLDKISTVIARFNQEIPLSTMILTREDLHSSCDVFPIKFHGIKQHYQVLHGDDVLFGLKVSDEHLRLRCEQQLKNLMLRLRSIYLHRSHCPDELLDALAEANRSFLHDIHACLFLKTGIAPEDNVALAAEFGKEFGIDTTPVNQVLGLRERTTALKPSELKQVFDHYLRLINDSARVVDQMEKRS
ncbi:MAG: hypothetical protein P1U77_17630 [Rubripirellula sp.]|nr:hypothetical protein [Rubripirellula sp.]